MKKMILFAAAAIMAFGASAQMSLVKDLAKKAASDNPQVLAEVLQNIQPALMNPESANDVLTWYTAGKAAFGLYDKMLAGKLLGQPVEEDMMNEILSGAYEFYQQALPLDSVVEMDKKTGMPKLNSDGTKKVKTKYSKEIIGALTSHMGDIARICKLTSGRMQPRLLATMLTLPHLISPSRTALPLPTVSSARYVSSRAIHSIRFRSLTKHTRTSLWLASWVMTRTTSLTSRPLRWPIWFRLCSTRKSLTRLAPSSKMPFKAIPTSLPYMISRASLLS